MILDWEKVYQHVDKDVDAGDYHLEDDVCSHCSQSAQWPVDY